MIDKAVFAREWRVLEDRFARKHGQEVVRRYYEFLSGCMATEQFAAASHAVFVANEFFPKPADFVGKVADAEWGLAQRAVNVFSTMPQLTPEGSRFPHVELWNQLSQPAKDAINGMGGLHGLAESRRDSLTLAANFRERYTNKLTETAELRALPSLRGDNRAGLTGMDPAEPATLDAQGVRV